MAKGGARPGAGRKKGVPNKKQAALRAAAQRLAETGGLDGTPLELLLATMRWLYQRAIEGKAVLDDGGKEPRKYGSIELYLMAVDVAAKAAPYVHPRLATVEANVTGQIGLYEQSLFEIARE